MNYDKKILNSYEKGTKKEFVVTNSRGSYTSTTLIGLNTKPYHGLFVKAPIDKSTGCPGKKNVKVLVSNVLETLRVGQDVYKLYTLNTKSIKEDGYKYLNKFTKSYIPCFEYKVGNVFISKKVTLVHKEEILYLEYLIENRENQDLKFRIEPLLTYRSLYQMKNKKQIPFTKREVKNGVKVNLSIEKNESLVIKTLDAKYRPESRYIESAITSDENKEYIEDLYTPGQFDVKIPAMSSKTIRMIISTIDMPIDNIEKTNYLKLEEERLDRFLYNMKDCKKEVRQLSLSAHELETRNMKNLRKSLLQSIPIEDDDITSILRSIEGTFLIPKKGYQARELLRTIGKSIEDGLIQTSLSGKKIETSREKALAAFFFVETINTYMKYAENYDLDKVFFMPIIENIIYSVLDEKNEDTYYFDDYLVGVQNGAKYDKYLDINTLWYNTLMIYIEMRNEKDVTHDKLLRIANMSKQAILENFYNKDLNTFKFNLEESYEDAKVDMIYTLSLSYPLVHNEIAKGLLKNLYDNYYTTLGMRKYLKISDKYDGYVYPRYLAHFIKASYRFNLLPEITDMSSVVLVKDILEQVNDSCIGALPERYNEATKEDDGYLMWVESMAEIIRIYDLLK